MNYKQFRTKFLTWTKEHPLIVGAGIVGSYARGEQRIDSDIDAVIFSTKPSILLKPLDWLALFGKVQRAKYEDWGAVTSVRVFYDSGLEIEFGISTLEWADLPVDPGTYHVVSDRFEILYDPTLKLRSLLKAVEPLTPQS